MFFCTEINSRRSQFWLHTIVSCVSSIVVAKALSAHLLIVQWTAMRIPLALQGKYRYMLLRSQQLLEVLFTIERHMASRRKHHAQLLMHCTTCERMNSKRMLAGLVGSRNKWPKVEAAVLPFRVMRNFVSQSCISASKAFHDTAEPVDNNRWGGIRSGEINSVIFQSFPLGNQSKMRTPVFSADDLQNHSFGCCWHYVS